MTKTRRPIVLLEPVGESSLAPRGLAPRLASLEGKVIGFLDEGDMSPYLERFRAILRDLARPAEVAYWRKPLMSKPSPSTLLEEVAERCDAVIVGYAH